MLGGVKRIVMCLALALVAGCRQTTAPAVDLTVSLQSNRTTAARGDTVTFVVGATGNNLVGVVIDYGDTSGDQYATSGATTAQVTFKHVFSLAGEFTVRTTVTDAIVGEKDATVAVSVN